KFFPGRGSRPHRLRRGSLGPVVRTTSSRGIWPVTRAFLVDTGPLVALLNRRDQHHRWAVSCISDIDGPLHTCEAVVSEACFLLRRHRGGCAAILELLARGVLRIPFRLDIEQERVGSLLTRYESVPMSLADACLVRMTELTSDCVLLTIDADFRVY